jgi:hypothetical protein
MKKTFRVLYIGRGEVGGGKGEMGDARKERG